MQVRRLGLTPVKGCRHASRRALELTPAGPTGDRQFCLVDPALGRVLRSVENPALVRAVAAWDGRRLEVDLPGESVVGEPVPTGETRTVDYWGRATAVEVQDGPWASAFSRYLGREVQLARVPVAGAVVYGDQVTVVTTGSLEALARRTGGAALADPETGGARFRATVVVEADGEHAEDGWVGRRLRLGDAVVAVGGLVPRCAVVDTDPVTGHRDTSALAALAGYRRGPTEVPFGVDGHVTAAGTVRVGDAVELERDL